MQVRANAGRFYQVVGHDFKKIGVQAFAVVVGPLDGAAHLGRQFFHLDTDALGINRAFVAIPGKGLYAHGGDDTAKTPESLQ